MACTREQAKYNFETSKGMELSDFWVPATPVSIAVVQIKTLKRARSMDRSAIGREKFAIISDLASHCNLGFVGVGQWAWWRCDHSIVTIWSLRWRSWIGQEGDFPEPNPLDFLSRRSP